MPRRPRLNGRNDFRKHRNVAERLARDISRHSRVEGIVFLGGLTRGFADQYSDIDVVVIVSGRDQRLRQTLDDLGRSEAIRTGFEVDLEVHTARGFSKLERTDWRRREYGEAEIVFDRRGLVKEIISRMMAVPDGFWVDRIARDWVYLQWYACPKKGERSIAEIWVDRGDLLSAHYSLNYAAELLIEMLYALNGQFVPVPKWRAHYLRNLSWKPREAESVLEELLVVRSISRSEVRRRVAVTKKLHDEIERQVLAMTGLSRADLVERFVQTAVFEKKRSCIASNPAGAPRASRDLKQQ